MLHKVPGFERRGEEGTEFQDGHNSRAEFPCLFTEVAVVADQKDARSVPFVFQKTDLVEQNPVGPVVSLTTR